MPDAKVPDAKGKKKGKKGQVFGLPWYVVAGGVVAAIALGLYLRKKSGSSATSGDTGATAQPQDTSGGAGSSGSGSSPSDSGAQNVDLTSLQDQLGQFESDLLGVLSSQPLAPAGSDPGPGTPGGPQADVNGQYFVDRSGILQNAGAAPGTFTLAPGIYTDVTSPGYQSSLQALTSYWQGLGSPTKLVGAINPKPQAAPSKAPVGHPQQPATQHPAVAVGSHPAGVRFTPTAIAAAKTPGTAVATTVARAQTPPRKGLQSGSLF